MQPQQDFKVGDIIIYNGNKTYAYILQVADDFIKIYDETNILTRINQREVDKKVDFNKKVTARDMTGNILQIDDVVKCST